MTESQTDGNYTDGTNISLGNDGIYTMHALGDNWLYAKTYSIGAWKRTESDKKITKDNIETEYSKYEWSTPPSDWDFNTKTYYERTEIATGAAEVTKIKNIYDLAGNMWAWTTEIGNHKTTSTTYAVIRGGGFMNSGFDFSVCRRDACHSNDTFYSINVGFRVVLYVQ